VAKHKPVDPHAAREAEKYSNPIPSREYILEYLRERGKPARRKELMIALGLEEQEQQEALKRRLRAMERDGQLIMNRSGAYAPADKLDLVRGRVIGHKDGYGFVIPDDAGEDLYLNPRYMRAVFSGDKVLVNVVGIDRKGRREAALVEVLERSTSTLTGRFYNENRIAFVVPNNKRLGHEVLIPEGEQNGAKPGQIVLVEILTQPTFHARPTGKVIEVLGEEITPGMETELAIYNHGIPHVWPEAVVQQVATMQEEVAEKDKIGRVDLRNLPLVTIDGDDAKDFDDAVYCEKKGKGWRLFVAIADVSHYVAHHSPLDDEAYHRGNSVYFPNKVIPMLPEVLSNGLCSLKPNVDRLCMVCEMTISATGSLTRYRFYEAVMHSRARLTYTEVTKWLEEPDTLKSIERQQLLPHLQNLQKLFEVLHASREERGAIDFDTTETKVLYDNDNRIKQIVPVKRTISHRIIEECMLMANVAAARYLAKMKIPALYRIHTGPTAEKVQDLQDFLSGLGLSLAGGKQPKPADYANLLQRISQRPDARLIQTVLLRSLSQAIYSPDNVGHFGLAFPAYAHFTSPIRRYPDLLIHRAIRHVLSGTEAEEFTYDHHAMLSIGEYCSMTERRADDATREAIDWLKCEFMYSRVGEEFDGIVTSVTSFGLFIELSDIYVEGLLHVTSLKGDYYHFDPIKHILRGERTGTIYRLGDQIQVRVARVDLESRQIDFALIDEVLVKKPAKSAKKAAKPRKKAKKNGRQKHDR
jgi:ribonuclease R